MFLIILRLFLFVYLRKKKEEKIRLPGKSKKLEDFMDVIYSEKLQVQPTFEDHANACVRIT